MSKALIVIVFSLIVALAFDGQAQAQTWPPRTVTVVDNVTLPARVPRAHERMRAKLESALSAEGWAVVQALPHTACSHSADCLPKVAKQAGSSYALRLSGEGNSENGYNVTLDLFSTADNQVRTNAAYCDLCNVDSLAEIVKRMGMEMFTTAEKAATKPRLNRTALSPAPAPTPAKPTPNLVAQPMPKQESGSATWVPWTLVGAGAVVTGYGLWALHKDGSASGSCSPTHDPTTCDRYSARGLGLGTAIGGGVVLLTGAIWGIISLTSSTSVSASPKHVAINVRF